MPRRDTRKAFLDGYLASLPFALVVVPFSMLFGVVATEAGLNVAETMAMSALVIAGASQFAAVGLLADNAPVLVVLATSLAVNLRMAMYSASIAPHLGAAPLWQRALAAYVLVDQSYGVALKRYGEDPALTPPQKMAYFLGASAAVCPFWYVFTWVGAVAGGRIPPEWGLDFALPVAFIALVAPLLRSLPHLLAAGMSVGLALAFAGLPLNLGLLAAAITAMAAGALAEILLERRR